MWPDNLFAASKYVSAGSEPMSMIDYGAGGSRTTWERATSPNAMFVVVDGMVPLPPGGPRSL
jgi:hypothetical protein